MFQMHQASLGQGSGSFVLDARRAVVGGGRLRRARVFAREELVVKGSNILRSSHRRCDQLPAPVVDPCIDMLRGSDDVNGSIANVTFDIVLVAKNGSIIVEEVHYIRYCHIMI